MKFSGFDNYLILARKKAGLSLEDLAQATQLPKAVIYKYELGISKPPSEILTKILKILLVENSNQTEVREMPTRRRAC